MNAIVIKLVNGKRSELKAKAKAELKSAGFDVVYEDEAGIISLDAVKLGGSEKTYHDGCIIIGKK